MHLQIFLVLGVSLLQIHLTDQAPGHVFTLADPYTWNIFPWPKPPGPLSHPHHIGYFGYVALYFRWVCSWVVKVPPPQPWHPPACTFPARNVAPHIDSETSTYPHRILLNPFLKFEVYWRVEGDTIHFLARANHVGYLGIAHIDETIARGDVIICWIDNDGKFRVLDRYVNTTNPVTKPFDRDDWVTDSAKKEGIRTTFKFHRLLDTGDAVGDCVFF